MINFEVKGARLGDINSKGSGTAHGLARWNSTLVDWFNFGVERPAPSFGGGERSEHDSNEIEEVALVFQSITMTNLTGSTSTSDSWGTGTGSGKSHHGRKHGRHPIVIIKTCDSSSAPLIQACQAGDLLDTVLVEAFDPPALGGRRRRRIVLGSAGVADIRHVNLRGGPGHVFLIKGQPLEDRFD